MNNTGLMDEIYRTYRDPLRRYVSAKVENPADAEDLTEEIFLKVLSSLDAYDREKSSLSTWIYTIAHNTICNFYRDLQRHPLPELVLPAQADDVIEEIENEILKEALALALESLPEREQDIILMYYYYDLPLRDIALKMGITYTNAKFIKHQAIAKLKLAMMEGVSL